MYILIKNLFHVYIHTCTKSFSGQFIKKDQYFIISKIKKRYPKMGRMHICNEKPQPVRAYFVCVTPLCFTGKNRQKKIRAPHNQILDLPLLSLHTFWSIYLVVNHLKSLEFSYFSPTLNSKIPTFSLLLGIVSYFFDPSYHMTPSGGCEISSDVSASKI